MIKISTKNRLIECFSSYLIAPLGNFISLLPARCFSFCRKIPISKQDEPDDSMMRISR